MADFDVKIETFTNLTLTQAAKARDKILEKCENDKKTALDEYSKKCGEKFSKMLKENQTKISTENHRNVSKEITECKKAVFSHREMLIEKLFADLKGKIADYKKSGEYKDYLEMRQKRNRRGGRKKHHSHFRYVGQRNRRRNRRKIKRESGV